MHGAGGLPAVSRPFLPTVHNNWLSTCQPRLSSEHCIHGQLKSNTRLPFLLCLNALVGSLDSVGRYSKLSPWEVLSTLKPPARKFTRLAADLPTRQKREEFHSARTHGSRPRALAVFLSQLWSSQLSPTAWEQPTLVSAKDPTQQHPVQPHPSAQPHLLHRSPATLTGHVY